MAQHPFAEPPASTKTYAIRRRSTRVKVAVPIILSGRDASGQAFRDETRTLIVSLHGALLQTPRQLLVGMQVTIENPRTGMTEKAICVHADEPAPGVAVHAIGVQLVRPGNLWGLEDPPADWKVEQATGRPGQAAVATPVAAPVVAQPSGAAHLPATQPASLEQQATQITDAAIIRVRGLVEEMLRSAFEDFRRRVDAKLAAAEERIDKRNAGLEQQAVAAVEGALERLRGPMEEKLATATEDFERRLDAKLTAAEERIDKRNAGLEQQAVAAIDGTVERLQVSVGELLGSAFEEFQPRLDANLAATEERVNGRFAALELQAAATIEGALERLRGPVEEKLSAASEDFQHRLEAKLAAEQERITKRSDESFAQLEDALATFRRDLEDELNARREEAIASTEQALRARIPGLIASIFAPPGSVPPSPNPETKE